MGWDSRRMARLTCLESCIRRSCLRKPPTGLLSGSLYANKAPASVISLTYTARSAGSNLLASACNPLAAVRACWSVPEPIPLPRDWEPCSCVDEVREEMEEEGDEGSEGPRRRNDSMNCWMWRLSSTCAG